MYYVYVITHVLTSRFYVGFSSNVIKRWNKHRSITNSEEGYYVHNALRKYGFEAFDFKILQTFKHKEIALNAEKYWISFLKSDEKGFGFNLTKGGECWPYEACVAGGKATGGKNLMRAWQDHRDSMLENVKRNGETTGQLAAKTWLLKYNKSEQGRKKSFENWQKYLKSDKHRKAVSASNKRRCSTGNCGHKSHIKRKINIVNTHETYTEATPRDH